MSASYHASHTPWGYAARGPDLRDDIAPDELERVEVGELAHADDDVLGAGVGEVAEAVDDLGRASLCRLGRRW